MGYGLLRRIRLLEIALELGPVVGDRVTDTVVAFVGSLLCGDAEQCGIEKKNRTYDNELKDRAHCF
jgi:hypothetical protein